MNREGVFIVGDFTKDRLGASYRRVFTGIGEEVDSFDMANTSALIGSRLAI
jgi:hypothetical protein